MNAWKSFVYNGFYLTWKNGFYRKLKKWKVKNQPRNDRIEISLLSKVSFSCTNTQKSIHLISFSLFIVRFGRQRLSSRNIVRIFEKLVGATSKLMKFRQSSRKLSLAWWIWKNRGNKQSKRISLFNFLIQTLKP